MSDPEYPGPHNTCATCAYFSALDTTCRYAPPKPFPMLMSGNQMQVIGAFPPTQAVNWCGAHSLWRRPQLTPLAFPGPSKDS